MVRGPKSQPMAASTEARTPSQLLASQIATVSTLTALMVPTFLVALLGFNFGVDLGQLFVIALAFLAVGWFRNRPELRQATLRWR